MKRILAPACLATPSSTGREWATSIMVVSTVTSAVERRSPGASETKVTIPP